MKFHTTVASLREAASAAAAAVPTTPSQVAYSAILLEVIVSSDGTSILVVTGTDGDTTVTAQVEVSDAQEGKVLLPPRPLLGWLAGRDARHRVQVSSGTDSVSVRPERGGAYSFKTMSAQLRPPQAKGDLVSAQLSGLRAAVGSVRPATDRRSPLVSVTSRSAGGPLDLAATDMYRITRARLVGAGWGDFDGILPLTALERIVKADPERVAFDPKARMFRATGSGIEVSARLAAAAFPDTEGMFEHAAVHSVRMNRSVLAGAVSGLAAVVGDATLRLSIAGSSITVSADNADTGSGTETVDLEAASPAEVVLHLKPAYLSDAISSVPGPDVTIGWSAPNAAVLVKGESDGLVVETLVMPVRVSS